jgi:hypothetical protein
MEFDLLVLPQAFLSAVWKTAPHLHYAHHLAGDKSLVCLVAPNWLTRGQ